MAQLAQRIRCTWAVCKEERHLLTTAPASRRPWLLAVALFLPELTGFAFFVVRAGLILIIAFDYSKYLSIFIYINIIIFTSIEDCF